MADHNPVPFDFVPFSEANPFLRAVDEWEAQGPLLSGVITYYVEAITDVHIVGRQLPSEKTSERKLQNSFFFRRAGVPVIPGSAIKGMIRAFMEALTNSWVSQATEEYPSVFKKQRLGFSSFSLPKNGIEYGPVVPAKCHPSIRKGKVDLATFLFGLVSKANGETDALQSRVAFDDISFSENILLKTVQLPDIPGDAFMGGPKPRVNNWWYFKPYSIKKHPTRSVADFIGKELWGRKFYFHQKPEDVIKWYDDPRKWPHQIKRGESWIDCYYKYSVETIPPKTNLPESTVRFERMPEPLLNLLIKALSLDKGHCHKIGYGKPFGLGSIRISIKGIDVYSPWGIMGQKLSQNFDTILKDPSDGKKYSKYIDGSARKWLSGFLSIDHLESEKKLVFTYPPFDYANFKTAIPWNEAVSQIRKHVKPSGPIPDATEVTLGQAEKIAKDLWGLKRTIHFQFYQKESDTWNEVFNTGSLI